MWAKALGGSSPSSRIEARPCMTGRLSRRRSACRVRHCPMHRLHGCSAFIDPPFATGSEGRRRGRTAAQPARTAAEHRTPRCAAGGVRASPGAVLGGRLVYPPSHGACAGFGSCSTSDIRASLTPPPRRSRPSGIEAVGRLCGLTIASRCRHIGARGHACCLSTGSARGTSDRSCSPAGRKRWSSAGPTSCSAG